MDPGTVLGLLRPLVLVLDGRGTIAEAHGGCGGFLGYDLDALRGRNVLELVDPAGHDEVASYLVESAGGVPRSTLLPLPFRLTMLDAFDVTHAVDAIPTGRPHDPELNGWIVVLVPLAMQAGPSRSLDAELGGADRQDVKQLLAEELQIDNAEWVTRLFLVDLPSRVVTGGRVDDFGLLPTIERAVTRGWSPWTEVGHGVGDFDVPIGTAPSTVQTLAFEHGWSLVEAAPIEIDGEPVAAYIRVSRPFEQSPFDSIRANVETRIRGLVDVTRLLYSRWRDQDALVTAARTDPLTGLANRDAFTDALAESGESVAVVYIDIDHFKGVNDEWGHAVGDQVLCEVARRISSACRRDDVVARVGGDEFVVLLRCVDDVIAGRICRRIIDEVAIPLNLPIGPRHISVSVGLAIDASAGDLVEQADQAMLVAKRQGRARLASA
jgi:diguanylate cyclase (GGDEF)-like protein